MSPEIGSNSDSWVFYEFERKMGKQIPYEGMSFTGPSLVLAVDGKAVDCQAPLAAYYYQYRNYRLLKRLLRNAVGSAAFFLLGLASDPFGTPAFLPYLLGSAVLCVHFLLSFFRFRKDCVSSGTPRPMQKPSRPIG